MRPFVFFFTFFSFFSAAAWVSARTETITSQDKRIDYDGKWRDIDSPGGAFKFIRKGRGKATLRVFNASAIAVTVDLDRPVDTVQISLDSEDHILSNVSFHQTAWSSSLDPNVPHTITVTKQNSDGLYTSIYPFLVTYPDSPEDATNSALPVSGQLAFPSNEAGASLSTPNSSASPSPPSTSSALSVEQPNTEPILSGAKLVGVIVGCITVPAIIFGIILYRRRMINKRKAASTAYWEYITTRAQQPPGPQSPPAPPYEGFDGVQAKEMP